MALAEQEKYPQPPLEWLKHWGELRLGDMWMYWKTHTRYKVVCRINKIYNTWLPLIKKCPRFCKNLSSYWSNEKKRNRGDMSKYCKSDTGGGHTHTHTPRPASPRGTAAATSPTRMCQAGRHESRHWPLQAHHRATLVRLFNNHWCYFYSCLSF